MPFSLSDHLYLVEIYGQTAREMVLKKAGQVGVSEYLISYVLHAADQRGATPLYVFPTDTHVSDFSSARIGPAIEASPYLQSIVVDGAGSRRGADRVTLKRVRDRFLYLRGGQVKPGTGKSKARAPQLKSVDADVVVYDELDEIPPAALDLGQKRLGHSAISEQRFVSTPTYPDFGIDARWKLSDQRTWYIKCPHCNAWQSLDFFRQVLIEADDLDRPVAWYGQDEGRAWAVCLKCCRELDRGAPGAWVPAFPGRRLVGYHISKLFSVRANLMETIEDLQSTDESRRREAYNQDLGLAYVPRGGRITDDALNKCLRDYAHGPVAGEKTYMGVDVGAAINVVIRGQMNLETGEWPQRLAAQVASFEEVGQLIRRYDCERVVVDALPETREARKLQADFAKGRVWLAYYTPQAVGLKSQDFARWDKDEGVVNLDRTRSLDATFARFYDCKATLPADAANIPDYYEQLKASVRVVEKNARGQPVARYVESSADHYGHAENYCAAALLTPPRGKRVRVIR